MVDFNQFYGYFHTLLTTIDVWIVISLPNFHRLCFWSMYKLWYVNMPNITAFYGRFSDFIVFLWEFSYIITYLKRNNFIRLLQVMWKLGVCPSKMTKYNKLCFKSPSLYNNSCLKFYRNPMSLCTIILMALYP